MAGRTFLYIQRRHGQDIGGAVAHAPAPSSFHAQPIAVVHHLKLVHGQFIIDDHHFCAMYARFIPVESIEPRGGGPVLEPEYTIAIGDFSGR